MNDTTQPDMNHPVDDRIERAFVTLRSQTASVDTIAAHRATTGSATTGASLTGTTAWRLAGAVAALLVVIVGFVTFQGDDGTDVAVGGDTVTAPDADTLAGSSWTLIEGVGPDGEIPLVSGWPITLTFADDGASLGGTAACNDYGGTVTIVSGEVTLGELGQNAAGCEPPVLASEAAYLGALLDIDSAVVEEGRLVLTGPGTRLVFERNRPVPTVELVGQLWLLIGLIQGEETTSPEGDPATLILNDDGTVEASSGCRLLTGDYIVSGNEVRFPSFSAEGTCPSQLQAQDNIVVSVLGDGFVPTIDGDQLTLTSAGNEGLTYRAISLDELGELPGSDVSADEELRATEWVFAGGDGPEGEIRDPRTVAASELEEPSDPPLDQAITLSFAGRAAGGTAICNSYGGFGDAEIGERTLSIGEIVTEAEGCGSPFDAIAAAYYVALSEITEWAVDDGTLVLTGSDYELLFEPVDESRLDGEDAPTVDGSGDDTSLGVDELLDLQPTTWVPVRGWVIELDGGTILCAVEPEGDICAGRWVTVLDLAAVDARAAAAAGDEITLVGALDEYGRFVVDPTDDSVGAEAAGPFQGYTLVPSDAAVIDGLITAAEGGGAIDPGRYAADGVALTLGGETIVTRTPQELADPANWVLDVEFFRGADGPFSALDTLARSTERAWFVGAHDHCASPPMPVPDVPFDRHLVIQPTGTDSCLQWWSVDLFLDADGVVVAVNLDFWDP